MSERFASDLVFILVVLLVAALLGFIIGYLIRRYQHLKERAVLLKERDVLMKERTALEDETNKLKIKLDSCQREKLALMDEIKALKDSNFDAKAASGVFGRKIVQDDLKIIEGIGEKIEFILKGRGIDTWLKLSNANDVEIKDILLADGGPKYSIHEPKTWPKQALLAFEGKWVELKKYQEELNAGK